MSTTTLEGRTDAIIHWLSNDLHFIIDVFEPASSDASFRRYFRVIHSNGSHIVMDAPPDKEDTTSFIAVAKLLKSASIHVPEIYKINSKMGFLLLEDFGDRNYLDLLSDESAHSLYQSAVDCLFNLQTRIEIHTCSLPHYDEALLDKELSIFYDWFLQHLLNIGIPDDLQYQLNKVLINSALSQPQVCVHRDYHSRNLMVLEQRSPGVIDFQDAVIGPITYDLVSLLRDCYISWPQHRVEHWMQQYHKKLMDTGIIKADIETFRRWFDLMGLQRHLKAIGIFSRLNLRDHKPGYMADIPRTLTYVQQICQTYSELDEFADFLGTQIIPCYQRIS